MSFVHRQLDNHRSFLSLPLQPDMLTVIIACKLIAEIAFFALCGQWIVGFLCGASRDGNPFYAFLRLLGRPWIVLARWFSPKVVLDRHLPLVAFFLLVLVWGAASFAKVSVCLQTGANLCK